MTSMLEGDLHELTTSAAAANDDVAHKNPYDQHDQTVWFWEPACNTGAVLTQDGVTQIAFHQYKAGTYTALDLWLNSTWQRLTELLPLTMAPNMVTTLGGLHCLVAYIVTWQYTPTFQSDDDVPNWVLLMNAFCCAAYYTLDCMDGKQARRTGTSSPLGQLFDHGMDCLCLQNHFSMCMTWVCLGSNNSSNPAWWLWTAQAALQFSFYMAQWEEYYTGVLPHATGNLGVTEVNYGLALACLVNAFVPNRATFYSQPVATLLPAAVSNTLPMLLPLEWIGMDADTFELKHALLMGWYIMVTGLCILSLTRVVSLQLSVGGPSHVVSAASKLLSPLILCCAPFLVDPDVLQREMRWFSLAFGLALTQITIKMIVFSMARQAFAAIQIADVIPLVAACVWIRYDDRWKEPGVHLLLQVLTVAYGMRILQWTDTALRQICDRLDIYVFTIKPKKQ